MRITFVTMQLGRGYVHGTERYVASLGAELARRGHSVSTLAGDPEGLRPVTAPGAEVEGEPGLHDHPVGGWSAVQGVRPRRAQAWLRDLRPDLVHLASPAHVGIGVARAAHRLRIPVAATAMDFWWVCPRGTRLRDGRSLCTEAPGWRGCLDCVLADTRHTALRRAARLPLLGAPLGAALVAGRGLAARGSASDGVRWISRQRILREAAREISHWIFPSPATRDALAPLLPESSWSVIPYGLEPRYFARSPRAPRSTGRPETRVVGFLGSLQRHKGAHLLLEAVERLGWKQTRVRIAGTPDDPEYAAELARGSEGLCVEWTGPLAPEAVPGFLHELDLLVLPSRWPENLPFALLEAQAAGLPVVASDVPGMAHRIADPGLRFTPWSAGDLARALEHWLASAPQPPPPVASVAQMADATLAAYRAAAASERARP